MRNKTILLTLLLPGLAVLSACNRAPDADDAAPVPAAVTPAATPPAAATPAMPADTAPAATNNEMSFADLDRNHDGKLTKDELPPSEMLALHFSVADTDGNGALSEAEVAKHRADMAASAGK